MKRSRSGTYTLVQIYGKVGRKAIIGVYGHLAAKPRDLLNVLNGEATSSS